MAKGTIQKVTNDSGSGYCKMPDGTLMCWGTATIRLTFEEWGAMYVSDGDPDVLFPVPFISAPVLSVTCRQKASGVIVNAVATGTKWTQVAVMRQSKLTDTSVALNWLAIGRWK